MIFGGLVSLAAAACGHWPLDTAAWRLELFEPFWGPACYRRWRREYDGRWRPYGEWEWQPEDHNIGELWIEWCITSGLVGGLSEAGAAAALPNQVEACRCVVAGNVRSRSI